MRVKRKAMGLSKTMSEKAWREITPHFSTERHKALLVAPGVSEGPVVHLLVANMAITPCQLHEGTRLATGRLVELCAVGGVAREQPSKLYDEYDYELPLPPA